MKITAWRTTRKNYVTEAFTGEGAKRFGGRWNPPGYAAVYVAQNLSLAILELIVHLDEDSDISTFVTIPVAFDSTMVYELPPSQIPQNWSEHPIRQQSQMVGQNWLEKGQSLLLKVPSSVVPSESNYVINPLHPGSKKLSIGSPQPLHIDQRISIIYHNDK